MLAADSLPGVAAARSEPCYVTYGTNMEHIATKHTNREGLRVV